MANARNPNVVYWLDPAFVVSIVIIVSIFLFVLVPQDRYISEFRQAPGSVGSVFFYYGIALVALNGGIAFGRLLGRGRGGSRTLSANNKTEILDSLRLVGYVSAFLSLIGYVYYIGNSEFKLEYLAASLDAVEGANYVLRDAFEKTAGITSLMNLACWWFVYVVVRRVCFSRELGSVAIAISLALVLLTVFRAFAVNERRAVLELAMPAVIACLVYRRDWGRSANALIKSGPIIGVMLLLFLFLITEYYRSWINYWGNGATDLNYIQWAMMRLAGYYATSVNNGITLNDHGFTTGGVLTFAGLFKAPFVNTFLFTVFQPDFDPWRYPSFLFNYLNPELNNPGGASVPFFDFGPIGATAVLFLCGLLTGLSFRKAYEGNVFAVLYYSVFYFALLEITRVWHFGSPIAVLSFLFLSIMYGVCAFRNKEKMSRQLLNIQMGR